MVQNLKGVLVMNRIEIKERAKAILGNNIFGNTWLMMLLVFLVYTVIIGAASNIVPPVATMIVTGPLMFGISYVLLNKIRTEENIDIGNLFKGFNNDFGQNILLGFLMSLFVALWSLLFVIPGIVKNYAYSMAFYIKNDHPEYNWKQCLQESIRITDGHKMDLFVLDLSFIGWYILGSLCLGVGTLWVMPYHQTAKALYYEELKNAQI